MHLEPQPQSEPQRRLFSPAHYSERLAVLTEQFLTNNPDYVVFAIASDPALRGLSEQAVRDQLQSYPGVRALAAHHVAHALYTQADQFGDAQQRGEYMRQARWLAQAAQAETGIDIHPGTWLDAKTFIDHGTGVVIGEQARIGRGTRMYHDVTLGAAGKPPDDAPRHPEVGEECLILVDVKILGHVVAGNRVTFGPRVTVTGNHITLGDGVKLGTGTQIGDNNQLAKGIVVGAGAIIPNDIGRIDQHVPAFSFVSRNHKGALQFETVRPAPDKTVGIANGR